MKSILQTKKDECYICKMLRDDPFRKITEEHHIFMGTANRKLSEKYGLKVYLCIMHHRTGEKAVHKDREMCLWLMRKGQEAFCRQYPELDFREIFGKNYVEDIEESDKDAERKESKVPGFRFIEDAWNEEDHV